MTSLGFRRDHDHIAERKRPAFHASTLPEPCPAPSRRLTCNVYVPQGLLPLLLYSGFAFLIPTLFFYVDYDYTDTMTRGLVIGGAVLGGLLVVLANSCCVWYNMALLFHTAVEVKVLDIGYRFAYAETTSNVDMGLVIAGGAVVILHLIPFFLTARTALLTFLAFAGIGVNVALVVFLDSSLLLVATGSALGLLAITQIVVGVCNLDPSLLTALKCACDSGLVTCDRFAL